MTKSGTVSFWTTGEAFYNLMLEYLKAGKFQNVQLSLEDAGLPNDYMVECWKGKFKLSGDTRTDEGLQIDLLTTSNEDWIEAMYTGLITIAKDLYGSKNIPSSDIIIELLENDSYSIVIVEKLPILKYIKLDDFLQLLSEKLFDNLPEIIQVGSLSDICMSNPNSTSGFLLNDGRFIQITHESHRYVERTLWKLGIVKKLSDGSKDEDAIRISFNTISSFLKYRHEMSDAQIVELVKASEWIKRFYLAAPNSESVQNVLLQQYAKKLDNGQKFANLCFLKEHLSMFLNEQIQLPIFNNEIDESFNGIKYLMVRTSPVKSVPGLFDSVKTSNDENIFFAVQEVEAKFEKFETEPKYFYQEFIDGYNGVANCINYRDKYSFTYSLSEKQGEIVSGGFDESSKLANKKIGDALHELSHFAARLSKWLFSEVQIEFVIDYKSGIVYIVQFRILNRHFVEGTQPKYQIDAAKIIGLTFNSCERKTVKKEDILFVKSGDETKIKSEELLKKKALVVQANVEFSHLLAMSISLNIPSIYATIKFNPEELGELVVIDTSKVDAVMY